MRFIKLSLCLVSALVLLSACGGKTSPPPAPAAPQESEAAQTNDSEAGVEDLPQVPANPYLANPKPVTADIQLLFDRALELHEAKNWPEAELAWSEITVLAPELSGPYLNLGLVYEAQQQFDAAKETYRQALVANRLNLKAYNQLAVLERKSGNFNEAEQLYLQALSIWPAHPTSHRNLAILYDLYMGKLEQALEHYQHYEQTAVEPDPRLKGWLADLRRRLDQP